MRFLDILVVLRLDLGQTENAFATRELVLLAISIAFYHMFGSGVRRNQNFEILDEKVTYVFRLFDFLIFAPFLFLLFLSFCCSD